VSTVGGAKVGRGAAGGAGSDDEDEDAAWQTAVRDVIDELGEEDSRARKRGKDAKEDSVRFACFFVMQSICTRLMLHDFMPFWYANLPVFSGEWYVYYQVFVPFLLCISITCCLRRPVE
jgi:hypothetical protein